MAVLGSGNGGCAVAFDFAANGHNVRIFDFAQFPDSIRSILKNKGVNAEGDLEGFAPITYAGHDIKRTIDGTDLVFVVGPVYSTRPFAEVSKPYLEKAQIVVVCPSSCGDSIEFKNVAGLRIQDDSVIVAETSTLPYAVRSIERGKIEFQTTPTLIIVRKSISKIRRRAYDTFYPNEGCKYLKEYLH